MTETNQQAPKARILRRPCIIVGGAILLLVLLLFIVALVLILTVFKIKEPRTEFLSATISGISPRISFPVIRIELNVTLDLKLLVKNPNQASFKRGPGKGFLLYRSKKVGEAELYPGVIPSKGSVTIPCRLSLEVDKIASEMGALINDVLAGKLVLEIRTRIPGRVTILGIFKKHAVSTSHCLYTLAIPAMKIQSQECKTKTKF